MKNKLFTALVCSFVIGISYSQKMNVAKLDSLLQVLETNNKFMGSIAVSHKENLVYAKSVGKADVETDIKATQATKYRVGSVSKMFTSILIFKAIEEKKLSLTQTLDTFYPTVPNASKITIANLLNHRSGIHNFTDDPAYLLYYTQPQSEQQMIDIIVKGKSDFEPNSKADYSNSNYLILSYILQKIYKKPYASLLKEKITKPNGLTNTYVGGAIHVLNNEANSYKFTQKWVKETETDMSIPMGAGAIVSNPTDLALFIEKLFGLKIINESSLKQMTALQDNFGMGIFQTAFGTKVGLGHNGGIDEFRSVVNYFPSDQVSVAITSNGKSYDNNAIVTAALNSFFNTPYVIPSFENINLTSADLDTYLGEYADAGFPLTITITKDNATLLAQATGQSAFILQPTEKDTFEFAAAGIKITFKPNEKQLILKQGGRSFTLSKK